MLGVLITLVAVKGWTGLGRLLLNRWLANVDPAAQWGISGLFGLGAIGTATLFVGLTPGGLRWGIVLVGVLAVAGLWGVWKHRPKMPSIPEGLLGLLLVPIALAFLFALVGVLAPSDKTEWDSLAYHLAVPKLWLSAGQIQFVSFIHQSNFPFAVDDLYIWGLQWGGMAAAKAFSLGYFSLGALTIFGLARQFCSERAGWWAATAFCTVPVVFWLSGTAYIDVAHGLYAGVGTILLARFASEPAERNWAWLGGLMLGFAAGSKYTGLQTLFVVGAVVLSIGFLRKDGPMVKMSVAAGLLAILICSPWYIKNVANTGNPIYPFFYSKLGGKNWDAFSESIYREEQQTFGAGRSPVIANYPDNPLEPARIGASILGLAYQPGRYINPRPTDGTGFAIGSLGFALMAAGLVWCFSGRAKTFEGVLLVTVALSFLLWFVLSQQVRYMIGPGACLAFLLGLGCVRLRSGAWLAAAAVAQALIGLYCYARFSLNGNVSRLSAQIGVALGQTNAEDYQGKAVGFSKAAAILNRDARGGKVALYDEVFGYFLDVPYFWANPGHSTELGYDAMSSGDDLIAAWKRLGITHVYVAFGTMFAGDQTALQRWEEAAFGSRPFSAEEVAAASHDLRTKYKVLLAQAIKSGRLTTLDARPGMAFRINP